MGIVGPARFTEMLLCINQIFKGEHEVRILTADVNEAQLPVYKMKLWYPKPLRFLDFFFRGLSFYRAICKIRKEYNFEVLFFGDSMFGIVPKFFLKNNKVGGMINDYMTERVTWRNFLKIHGGKGLLLQKQIEKFSTHYLDYIIVCSDFLKKRTCQTYHCPENKVFRLYHGIDVKSIIFNPKSIKSEEPIKILFVKYLFTYGGLQYLASALAKLKSYDFQLTILGPPIFQKENVMKLFKDSKHVAVEFYGSSSQDTVHFKMNEHHILCVPSILEAQGLANVEGLAHGISVVSTKEGGIPEVLNFGKIGWLCEPADSESLEQALISCIETPMRERLAIQVGGREFVEKHFEFSVGIENLLNFLNSTLQVTEK